MPANFTHFLRLLGIIPSWQRRKHGTCPSYNDGKRERTDWLGKWTKAFHCELGLREKLNTNALSLRFLVSLRRVFAALVICTCILGFQENPLPAFLLRKMFVYIWQSDRSEPSSQASIGCCLLSGTEIWLLQSKWRCNCIWPKSAEGPATSWSKDTEGSVGNPGWNDFQALSLMNYLQPAGWWTNFFNYH